MKFHTIRVLSFFPLSDLRSKQFRIISIFIFDTHNLLTISFKTYIMSSNKNDYLSVLLGVSKWLQLIQESFIKFNSIVVGIFSFLTYSYYEILVLPLLTLISTIHLIPDYWDMWK